MAQKSPHTNIMVLRQSSETSRNTLVEESFEIAWLGINGPRLLVIVDLVFSKQPDHGAHNRIAHKIVSSVDFQ
jgi:hypothetical protein